MLCVLTGRQMQDADRQMTEKIGIPSDLLMERAALAITEELKKHFPQARKIGVFAGLGNNGGDGIAAARILALEGYDCKVCLTGPIQEKKNQSLAWFQYQIAEKAGVSFTEDVNDLYDRDLLIDAVFGTGLSRPVEEEMAMKFQKFQDLKKPILSVDIPSGVAAGDGRILGTAIKADLTVSLAYLKVGQLLFPGKEYCGELILRDIGIKRPLEEDQRAGRKVFQESDLNQYKPARFSGSNKGSYGHVLVIAGSYLMAGAACFAAKACVLSGAGLVKVLTDERNREIVQSQVPEALLSVYGNKLSKQEIKRELSWADVVLIGPGLGQTAISRQLFSLVMEEIQTPMVMDADALNLLSEDLSLLQRPHLDLVLTPHIGEMARLKKVSPVYVAEHMIPLAEEFANDYQVTLVLKNAASITAIPFSDTIINTTGNNGMSTGGSGDVLAGLLAGLMAQHLPASKAAPLAVYLHGKAGDLARKKCGVYAMAPREILDAIHNVLV